MNTPDLESSSALHPGATRAVQELHRRADQLLWVGECRTGRLLFASAANETLFECSLDELLNESNHWLERFEEDDRVPLRDCLKSFADNGTAGTPNQEQVFKLRLRPHAGGQRILQARLFRLDERDRESEGGRDDSADGGETSSAILFGAVVKDITELEATLLQLRDTEVLYDSLVENLPLNVIRKDTHGKIVFVNEQFCSLIGMSRAELYGKTDFDLFPEELAQKYTRDDRHVIETGATLHAEEEHQTSTGEKSYVEVLKGAVRDTSDRIIGVQVIFWDVTQRKRTEKKLRHERYLLHTLLNNLPDSIYFKNEKSEFVRVSKSLAEKFGLKQPTAAIGRTDADFFTVDHAKLARDDEVEMMQTGTPVLGKVEKETWRDGHTTWCSTSKLPLRDDSGRVVGTFGISRDITDLIEAEEALARERDLLQTLIDNLPDLIYVKDAECRFVTVNRAAQKMLGATSRDEVIGKTKYEFLSKEHADRYDEDDRYVLDTGKPLIDREECLSESSGKERWLLSTKVPLRDEQGNVIGLVGIDRDNTKRKQMVEALRKAKETADAANTAKSDFLANMSHEIRTPMNAIIGMTELLLDTSVDPTQREYLNMIHESGDSLLTIINDILDFSKIEANKLELDEVEFSPRESLEDTMRSLALRAHDKGIEIAVRIAPDVPDYLKGDIGRLRQVLINLVGNAIKFTREGEVVLDVSVADVDSSGVLLKILVQDTGIGIPEDKQKAIFRAFEQADTSTTRSFGGTGLGLAISSRIARLMQGDIRVESKPGSGSTFVLTARMAMAKGKKRREIVHAETVIDAPVLVVDDNSTNCRILVDMLTNWGMKPTAVQDAETALEQIRIAHTNGQPYKLLLSDVNMPVHDGFELARWIREDSELADLPVIMLTSAVRPQQDDEQLRLRIASHLLKPVKQSELFDAIVDSLQGRAAAKSESRSEMSDRSKPLPSLSILLAEDNVVNQRLALGVLNKQGHEVTVVENGALAVTAAANGNYDLVLMDVQMPEMDGFEATRQIRAAEQSGQSRIPIIAMTAHAMKGDRERCIDAGMDDYIAKPIRLNVLVEKLEAHLGEVEPNASSEMDAASESSETIRWDVVRETVQNDEDLLKIILESYVEEAPTLVARIEEAQKTSDFDSLKLAAHSLKGSLKAIAADHAMEKARAVEFLTNDAAAAEIQSSIDAMKDAVVTVTNEANKFLAQA